MRGENPLIPSIQNRVANSGVTKCERKTGTSYINASTGSQKPLDSSWINTRKATMLKRPSNAFGAIKLTLACLGLIFQEVPVAADGVVVGSMDSCPATSTPTDPGIYSDALVFVPTFEPEWCGNCDSERQRPMQPAGSCHGSYIPALTTACTLSSFRAIVDGWRNFAHQQSSYASQRPTCLASAWARRLEMALAMTW